MEKLMTFSQKYPWLVMIIFVIGCFISSYFLKDFTMDTSPDSFMEKNDPHRIVYDQTMATFGSDTILMIYLEDPELFTVHKLEILYELVSELCNQKEFPGISRVESLYSVNNIKGYPGYLDNRPLMDYPPESEEEALEIRNLAKSNPIMVGNLISEDGRSTVINLYLEPITTGYDREINSVTVKKVETLLYKSEGEYHKQFKILFDIGNPYIVEKLSKTILEDLGTILPLSLLTLLLMLIITTGTLSGALLPFITSLISILYTAGFMGALGLPLNMLTFTVPILVIVIGSTEDVHIIAEYLAGFRRTGKRDMAIRYMSRAIGTAVFLTALTTFLGFSSISVNKIVVLRQFGITAGFIMFINPLVTFLAAPVYLKYFGSSRALQRKASWFSRFTEALNAKVFHLVTHKRKTILASFTLITLVIGFFAIFISVDNDSVMYFRRKSEIPLRISTLHERLSGSQLFFITLRRKSLDEFVAESSEPSVQEHPISTDSDDLSLFDDSMELFMDSQAKDALITIEPESQDALREVEGEGYTFQKPWYLKAIREIQLLLREKFPFDKTTSIADYIALIHREMNVDQAGFAEQNFVLPSEDSGNLIAQYAMNLHQDEITSYITSDWQEANIVVRHYITSTKRIREELKRMTIEISALLAGVDPMLEFQITGESILTNNAADTIIKSQTLGLSLLLGTILIIMSLLFMNLKAGIVGIIPNLFPLFILYGTMGIFKIPLNVGTSMVAAIAIGLTVDDTIHFMARFNKEMRKYQDRTLAVKKVICSEIRPVVSTSIALIVGFSILGFAQVMPIVYFGILSAIVMFCALLADLFITPVLLTEIQLINLPELAALKLADSVKDSPLFAGMSMIEIKTITLLGKTASCPKGEYIIRSGEPGDKMFVLLGGSARVERATGDKSKSLFIDIVSAGSLLGEISLLRNVDRTANVIAAEEVTYLEFDWNGLLRLQKSAKSISIKLYRNIAAILGQRLVEMTNKVQTMIEEQS